MINSEHTVTHAQYPHWIGCPKIKVARASSRIVVNGFSLKNGLMMGGAAEAENIIGERKKSN